MQQILFISGLLLYLIPRHGSAFDSPYKDQESHPQYWRSNAHDTLKEVLKRTTLNTNVAKNVILFIGDGMDVSTITAGRIWRGQQKGFSGEEHVTAIDKFPHVGLSKVYTLNGQSPDSAGTATALLTGVKTKTKLLGLNGRASLENCSSAVGNEVKTILEHFASIGKSTGLVTTTYVTHATPASSYAHSASRGWLTDADLTDEAKMNGCKDVGSQLIEQGRKINVLLGGGRVFMRPIGYNDEEYGRVYRKSNEGRTDGRNLIEEWLNLFPSDKAKYVWNKTDFDAADPQNTNHLLGLFQPLDMLYDHERVDDIAGEPSIAEMTKKAISILQKNSRGYFLLVEGGRIDHAHHETKANTALSEFAAFDDAVKVATRMTSEQDTLIVVTADHGHMFTMGGNGVRGNPVNGFAENHRKPLLAKDGLKYTTIAYGNGHEWLGNGENKRLHLTESMTSQMDFRFPAAIPLPSETHSATDVAVFARGPMAHIFGGVYEQNYVGFAMMYASCVGVDKRHCKSPKQAPLWDCKKYISKPKRKNAFGYFSPVKYSALAPWWCKNSRPRWTVIQPTEQTITTDQPSTSNPVRYGREKDNTRPWRTRATTEKLPTSSTRAFQVKKNITPLPTKPSIYKAVPKTTSKTRFPNVKPKTFGNSQRPQHQQIEPTKFPTQKSMPTTKSHYETTIPNRRPVPTTNKYRRNRLRPTVALSKYTPRNKYIGKATAASTRPTNTGPTRPMPVTQKPKKRPRKANPVKPKTTHRPRTTLRSKQYVPKTTPMPTRPINVRSTRRASITTQTPKTNLQKTTPTKHDPKTKQYIGKQTADPARPTNARSTRPAVRTTQTPRTNLYPSAPFKPTTTQKPKTKLQTTATSKNAKRTPRTKQNIRKLTPMPTKHSTSPPRRNNPQTASSAKIIKPTTANQRYIRKITATKPTPPTRTTPTTTSGLQVTKLRVTPSAKQTKPTSNTKRYMGKATETPMMPINLPSTRPVPTTTQKPRKTKLRTTVTAKPTKSTQRTKQYILKTSAAPTKPANLRPTSPVPEATKNPSTTKQNWKKHATTPNTKHMKTKKPNTVKRITPKPTPRQRNNIPRTTKPKKVVTKHKSNRNRPGKTKPVNPTSSSKQRTTKPKKRKNSVTPITKRVFRRELTTESETVTEISTRLPTQRTTYTTTNLIPKTTYQHPREAFLDQIAYAIRHELQYIKIESETEDETAKLDLSIQVRSVKRSNDQERSLKKSIDSADREDATVVCMLWNTSTGLVYLSSNSSKHSFLYKDSEEVYQKQVNTASGSNIVLIILILVSILLFIICFVLVIQLKRKNDILASLMDETEKKRKAALAKLKLEDVDDKDRVVEGTQENNNNSRVLETVSGWLTRSRSVSRRRSATVGPDA